RYCSIESEHLLVDEERVIPEVPYHVIGEVEDDAAVGRFDAGEQAARGRSHDAVVLRLPRVPGRGRERHRARRLIRPGAGELEVVVEDVAFGAYRPPGEAVRTFVLDERRGKEIARDLDPVEAARRRNRHLVLGRAQRGPGSVEIADLAERQLVEAQVLERLERIRLAVAATVERVAHVGPRRVHGVEVDYPRRVV